jgi:membrane-anchored glycerophosphoryl diester phosphodiesterase (GDPDase)
MQKENEIKAERKTQHNTSKKLFNEAHRRAEALVEIQVLTFLFYFF